MLYHVDHSQGLTESLIFLNDSKPCKQFLISTTSVIQSFQKQSISFKKTYWMWTSFLMLNVVIARDLEQT